ncbi:MAG: SHOCT domain-containing protein [Bacteroidales bacterium]
MHDFGPHYWGMGWGWIIGLIIIILIVWVVVRAVSKSNTKTVPENKPALDILKERYARGEIDKDEFEKRKKDLM